MDLGILGSAGVSMRTLKLKAAWDRKLATGDYNGKTDPMKKTQAASVIQQQIDAERENEDKRLKTVSEKALAGKKLTPEERRYLQAKNPELYQKMRLVEEDQKRYEQELKRCRTKEDVQHLKAQRIGAALSTVRAVEHDSSIPAGKKLELCRLEQSRCEKFEESTQAFVRRGEYGRLPTEAEKAKTEKEERDAEEAVREEKQQENRTREKERRSEDSPSVETEREAKQAEKAEETARRERKTAVGRIYSRKRKKSVTGQPQPGEHAAQIVESPVARTVQKAKAAYTAALAPENQSKDWEA